MVVLSNVLKTKSLNKELLLKGNTLKNKKLPIWFINIGNKLIDNTLIDALKILPANFVVYCEQNNFVNFFMIFLF